MSTVLNEEKIERRMSSLHVYRGIDSLISVSGSMLLGRSMSVQAAVISVR